MTVKQRLITLRLIEKIERQKEYSQKIGIEINRTRRDIGTNSIGEKN